MGAMSPASVPDTSHEAEASDRFDPVPLTSDERRIAMTHYLVGDVAYTDANPVAVANGRVVLVVDPDDREQTDRLWVAAADPLSDFRRALREFANPTPPKPDEPQGLGAVVEDRWGHVFVRVEGDAWRNTNETSFCIWLHIDAVRVLAEGVTQ